MSSKYSKTISRFSQFVGNGFAIDRLELYISTITGAYSIPNTPKTTIILHGPERTGRMSAVCLIILYLLGKGGSPPTPRALDPRVEWLEGFYLFNLDTAVFRKEVEEHFGKKAVVVISDAEVLTNDHQRVLVALARQTPHTQVILVSAHDTNFIDALRYNVLLIGFNPVDDEDINEMINIRSDDLAYDIRKRIKDAHVKAIVQNAEGRPGLALILADELAGLRFVPHPDDLGYLLASSFSSTTAALLTGRFDLALKALTSIHPRIFLRKITDWTIERYKDYMENVDGAWCNDRICPALGELYFACEDALAHKADWNVLKLHFIHRWNKIMENLD